MPLSFVTEDDLALAREWENAGCLVPASPEKASANQISIYCRDGRRPHMYQWLMGNFLAKVNQCCDHVADPVIFPFPDFGAALRYGLNNPVTPDDETWKNTSSEFLLAQRLAHGRIDQINLMHHWPCAMANMKWLSLEESVVWVLMSKTRIKHSGIVRQVAPLLWFDTAPGEHLVWRMKLEQFVEHFRTLPDQRYFEMLARHRILLEETEGRAWTEPTLRVA